MTYILESTLKRMDGPHTENEVVYLTYSEYINGYKKKCFSTSHNNHNTSEGGAFRFYIISKHIWRTWEMHFPLIRTIITIMIFWEIGMAVPSHE